MKLAPLLLAAAVTGSLVPLGAWWIGRAGPEAAAPEVATRLGTLVVSTHHAGSLESRYAFPIASRLSHSSTIIELAPEGSQVKEGDVLVRFDPGDLEREVISLEREARLAHAQFNSLEQAEIPLKLEELGGQLAEAQAERDLQESNLADTEELRREELVAEQELTLQRRKAEQARQRVSMLERSIQVTRDHLHPTALERARAAVETADRELELVRERLLHSSVAAPAPGLVVYRPLTVGGEYRTVRIGDSVFRNQPFMMVADMSNLIVRCPIPESELGGVPVGATAAVTPQAFPDLRLDATVESIGTMAQTLPGQPSWQKYFVAQLQLNGGDPRLRSGMTVDALIESARRDQALLLPRRAVRWGPDGPTGLVREQGQTREVPLVIGLSNDADCEVREGLAPGASVVLP